MLRKISILRKCATLHTGLHLGLSLLYTFSRACKEWELPKINVRSGSLKSMDTSAIYVDPEASGSLRLNFPGCVLRLDAVAARSPTV